MHPLYFYSWKVHPLYSISAVFISHLFKRKRKFSFFGLHFWWLIFCEFSILPSGLNCLQRNFPCGRGSPTCKPFFFFFSFCFQALEGLLPFLISLQNVMDSSFYWFQIQLSQVNKLIDETPTRTMQLNVIWNNIHQLASVVIAKLCQKDYLLYSKKCSIYKEGKSCHLYKNQSWFTSFTVYHLDCLTSKWASP